MCTKSWLTALPYIYVVRLAWFVLLVSRDCCVSLFQDAMSLSAVCDCDIS